MATVKVKFRPSVQEDKEGRLFFRVIHHRVARQIKSELTLKNSEWNSRQATIVWPDDSERKNYLRNVAFRLEKDLKCLHQVICRLEETRSAYTADDVIQAFTEYRQRNQLFSFVELLILKLKGLGRIGTADSYASTARSLKRFVQYDMVYLDEIDCDFLKRYECYLHDAGLCPNTISFHLRNLRSFYNQAVEKGLAVQPITFKHVYTGVEKTVKRALLLKDIQRIARMDLHDKPNLAYARDMFMFSFFTRGMSMVDMAFLKKDDLQNGVLTYRRRKTSQLLTIRWEACMQAVVDRYQVPRSPYLLPILNPSLGDLRRQYQTVSHMLTRRLHIIGCLLDLSLPLTMYVARHSWASIAREKQIPLPVISEGMGHDNESTTRIYLASIDAVEVDNANRQILDELE